MSLKYNIRYATDYTHHVNPKQAAHSATLKAAKARKKRKTKKRK